MNAFPAFESPFSELVVERLGWVLLHSLWQFALIALLAGVAVRAMRQSSAATRYGFLIVSMAVSVAAPAATWLLQPAERLDGSASRMSAPGKGWNGADRLADHAFPPAPDSMLEIDGQASDRATAHDAAAAQLPLSPPIPRKPAWSERAQSLLRPWLAWIVAGWSLGVVLCSARPLLGWHTLRRLQRVGVSPVTDDVPAAMNRVSSRLGLRRAVCVLQSTLAQAPVVIGYLSPVILLPVSLLANLPAVQLEAILAHELAHVRRHDFIVNLLQTLVETLFFYHPAVWWLSHRIRIEREHCCDDLVVALLGNRVEYGRALVAIEQLRGRNAVFALGAGDGSLLARVRRIVGFKSDQVAGGLSGRVPVAWLSLACLVAAFGLSMSWSLAAKDESDGSSQPAIADLPGDIAVELIAVGFHPSKDRAWWKPDGSRLEQQPEPEGGNSVLIDSPERAQCREFLIEIRGLPPEHSVYTDYGVSSATGSRFSDRVWVGEHAAGPFKTDTTWLRIGLTTQPYGPAVTIDTSGRKQPNVEIPAGLQPFYDKIVPLSVAESAGQTELLVEGVAYEDLHKLAAWELRAIDTAGGSHRSSTESVPPSGERHIGFNLPRNSIARFEYRLRPYRHWVTFENVSLQPGQRTGVKVTSVSAVPSKPDRWAAELPEGLKVELVGLAEMAEDPQEWWSPDGTRLEDVPLHEKTVWKPVLPKDRRAVVRVDGIDSSLDVVANYDGLRWDFSRMADEQGVRCDVRTFPDRRLNTGRIEVGVATEPLSPVRILDAHGDRVPPAPDAPADHIAEDIEVEIVVAAKSNNPQTADATRERTWITFVSPVGADRQFDLELKLIDRNGTAHDKEYMSWSGESPRNKLTYAFDVPFEDVDRFEYRMRLYRHWVTFENVSLEPGRKTRVRVGVDSLPAARLRAAAPDPDPAALKDTVADPAQPADDPRADAGDSSTGRLTGRFVYDGELPLPSNPYEEFSKIDAQQPQKPGPDGRKSGVEATYREFLKHKIRPRTDDASLVVGKEGGIANVVVWVTSKDIPWSPPRGEWLPATLRLRDGNYTPRIAAVTVGQPLALVNDDPVSLNFHAEFQRPLNPDVNVMLQPRGSGPPQQFTFRDPEPYPTRYRADIGPWATGFVFVHSSPFVAVSQPDGSFTLPGLPPGEWEFRAWHERAGYIQHWPKGQFKQTIKPGENSLGTIELHFPGAKAPGPAGTPPDQKNREQIGEVLGKPVYRDEASAETLHGVFIGPILDKYRKAHRDEITPTAVELRSASEFFDNEHRLRIDADGGEARIREQMQGIEDRLARRDLDEAEVRKLEFDHSRLKTKLKRPSSYGFAQFILDNWKFQKHLYDEYGGGRILFQQAGLEAFDAMRQWLETREKEGAFKITDAKLRAKLFEYWTRQDHPGMLTDEEVIRREFVEPKWLAGVPEAAAPPAAETSMEISANGEIVGRLIDAATLKPVEGATIACGAIINDSGKGGGANAVTDARGRYRLIVPSPGIYNVWLKKFDADPSMTAAADDGIVVEARKVASTQLHLVVGRKVAGKVVDADGKPFGDLTVSCHSAARPHSGGVQSVQTKADGSFEFRLPPGRAYVYVSEQLKQTVDNPFGIGRSAGTHLTVSTTEELAPFVLTLRKSEPKFGDPEWLRRSTPGTLIVRRDGNQDVTGTVVDLSGKPIAGAKVFREDGPIVTTGDKGEFRIETLKGTQFVMHAVAPGYHAWFGTPTSGDVLKIVMDAK